MDTAQLRRWLIPQWGKAAQAITPGLYHYMRASDGLYTRFHLRVEPDGHGLLLANAAAAARLSPTGVLMAKGLLEEQEEKEIVTAVQSRFKGAAADVVQADLRRVAGIIHTLLAPEDNYPIFNLDELNPTVFESQLFAPVEVSIPLAAPDQLVPLLDRLWQIGIPHVTFLTPENPDLAYLVQAVERAEDLGMIAGVRSRVTDLAQGKLLRDVAQAGVDHITVIVASMNEEIHDTLLGRGDHSYVLPMLADIQANEVYPMVEIPLVESTLPDLGETLAALQTRGVYTFSFFAIVAPDGMDDDVRAGALPAQAMPQTADWIEETADQLDVRFLWQPSVQRDPQQTLAAQVLQGPRCSGDVAARIEPNGDVIPPRGPHISAGNVFHDEWQTIWQNDAFTRYRERVAAPTRCPDCPGLALCAADCPREAAGWAYQ